jgi:glycosyltransferase involved in cell wall biosynthesis
MINVKTISLTKRFAYYLESFRLEHYEKTIYESGMFDSITFFSSDDMKFFETKWRKCNSDLKMFPLGANGFDVIKEMDTNHTLLFIGRLDAVAIPNVEAIKWFCDNVFADILRNVPDTKLIIAGANPDKEIYDYRNQNIEVIANFDNLLDVYNLSDCVILPLQSGGGVKGKLLEAAALKKIIITTDHGIEGTEFEDKKHVLLANSTREFAEKCVFAMLNKERCIPMINAAFSLFEQRYNWEKIGKMYNDYLNNRKV